MVLNAPQAPKFSTPVPKKIRNTNPTSKLHECRAFGSIGVDVLRGTSMHLHKALHVAIRFEIFAVDMVQLVLENLRI